MTETPSTPHAPEGNAPDASPHAALEERLAALEARLAALEARQGGAQSASAGNFAALTRRLAEEGRAFAARISAAWNGFRGGDAVQPSATGAATATAGSSPLATALFVVLGLIAALLAWELVEEVAKGLARFWRWLT
ncbi:hypothetical protein [Elioraea thermophila]|uniref:hypothetical protein n=1 Tax=Elioraea thermophila TaxID=2185104 RepID=UPI000DF12FFC|nr:hypothetical protein [Elioraea thermophila]